MSDRARYEANVCVLLRREGRWLLTIRGPEVSYAPGTLGLVGGHVEPDPGPDVLEATARREAREETGLDLTAVALHYLSSALYLTDERRPVLTVTYAGELPMGEEARLADPAELSAVGWWTTAEAEASPICSPWIPPLLRAAEALLDGLRR